MAASRLNRFISDQSGYAATTALLTVAALSIIAAAGLNLSQSQDRLSKRVFKEAVRDEALNEALMRFAGRLQSNPSTEVIEDSIAVENQKVTLRGEHEALKWPASQADALTTVAFNHRAKGITLDEARRLLTQARPQKVSPLNENDCLRRVFSPFGQATTDDVVIEKYTPAFTTGTSKEGQVWRLRAVMGTQVRELYVRFTGKSQQFFAVIAEDNFNAKEVPACVG